MKRRKILALFLVLIMLILLIPVNFGYADDVIGSNGSILAGGQQMSVEFKSRFLYNGK